MPWVVYTCPADREAIEIGSGVTWLTHDFPNERGVVGRVNLCTVLSSEDEMNVPSERAHNPDVFRCIHICVYVCECVRGRGVCMWVCEGRGGQYLICFTKLQTSWELCKGACKCGPAWNWHAVEATDQQVRERLAGINTSRYFEGYQWRALVYHHPAMLPGWRLQGREWSLGSHKPHSNQPGKEAKTMHSHIAHTLPKQ